jgi:FkbM family methyltransferase
LRQSADFDKVGREGEHSLASLLSHTWGSVVAAFRQFRRRFLPFLNSVEARKRFRNRVAHRLGFVRSHAPWGLVDREEWQFDDLLSLFVAAYKRSDRPFRFLQIGAFDGVASDHLRRAITSGDCEGILVEPQPPVFERLKQNYAHVAGLTFLNVAIDRESGVRPFYTTRNRSSVLASFDKHNLTKHGISDDQIVAETMRCMTVAEALASAQFDEIDLLQIDAEGYDWQIIQSIDFEQLRPAIVRFEIAHLPQADREACLAHLHRYGYRFLCEQMDMIALQPLAAQAAA